MPIRSAAAALAAWLAVAHLGTAAMAAEAGSREKVLDLHSRVLELAGEVVEVQGRVLQIEGLTSGLAGTLADLGAQVTEQEIRIELSADVPFDFDKAELRPEAAPALARIVEVLGAYPEASVVIEGHTDSKGRESSNQKLSDRRARTVRDWLVEVGGVDEARLATKGLGESRPVAPNTKPDGSDDPEGRQRNRRVEIVVRKG